MIRQVRKHDKSLYVEAACDVCEAICEKSRINGRGGNAASDEAQKLAKGAGWQERLTLDKRTRRRSSVWTVHLLCPACHAAQKSPPATSA